MLRDLLIGAIIGCGTCCFLFHHFGLLDYGLILKLIEGYITTDASPSTITEKTGDSRITEVVQRDNNILGLVSNNKSQRSSRTRLRSIHKIEAKEKNNAFPFNSPIVGEKKPLWSHRYSAKLEAAVGNIYEAWHEAGNEGWFLSSSHISGLKIFRKHKPAGVDIVKGCLLIPYPVTMIIAEINNRESKLRFEVNTKDYKKLATYGQGTGVSYSLLKTPSRMLSPRDLVVVFGTCLTERGGNVILFPGTSVAFDTCLPKSGIVRAELNFGGWVFEVMSSTSTMVTYMVDIDIKGSIPAWIANQSTENAGKTPLNLCKFMQEKHGPFLQKQRSLKLKRKYSYSFQEENDGLIYGSEDDLDESVWDSTEESSEALTELMSETQSSIALESLGDSKLMTDEKANIISRLDIIVEMVLKQTDSDSKKLWKRTSSTDVGVVIYRRKDGASGFLGRSIIKFEPQKIYNALLKPSFRKAYDPMLKSLRVVEQFDDLNVLHMQHQTTNFLSRIRRDLLIAVKSQEIGSKFVVAGTSIYHPACPENPKMKRVNIGIAGWVVEEYKKRPGHSVVSLILDIDFGKLPKRVVKYVNKRQITVIHDLATAIKRKEDNCNI